VNEGTGIEREIRAALQAMVEEMYPELPERTAKK